MLAEASVCQDRGDYGEALRVLQAALDGEGVALGWMHIVSDLVEAGRLRTLGEPLETDRPFHVLTRRSSANRPSVTAMRAWLRSTMAAVDER